MARRRPVSIASGGLYRTVGASALGLAMCVAFLSDSTPEPADLTPNAAATNPSPDPRRERSERLADRDIADPQTEGSELASLLIRPDANPDLPEEDQPDDQTRTQLPKPGFALAGAESSRPTPAQIDFLIAASYRRSGNNGGGD